MSLSSNKFSLKPWTLYNSGGTQGGTTVWISAGWIELNVVVRAGWNGVYGFTFFVSRAHINATDKPYRFIQGWAFSDNDRGKCIIEVKSNYALINDLEYNGTSYTTSSDTKYFVYYR